MGKKILFMMTLVILVLVVSTSLLWAEQKTVTITWTSSDLTNIQGYNVYSANNSSMLNKTLLSNCNPPTEISNNKYSITCTNVEIAPDDTHFFTVEAQFTDNSKLTSTAEDVFMPAYNLEVVTQ